MASAVRCAALGDMLCCGEASAIGSGGIDSTGSPLALYRTRESCIPTRSSGSMRHNLRQEPYAVVPLVRICAGGGGQLPSLPQPLNLTDDQKEKLQDLLAEGRAKVADYLKA